MRKRASDWTPLEPSFRGVIQRGLSGVPRTQSASSTGELDKSLRGPGIWRMGRQSIEWGTDVEYVYAHMAHRKKAKQPQIFLLGKGVQREILDVVTRYIIEGRK